MIFSRPKPAEVFTPRSTEVNTKMYIERHALELKLRRAVNGTQNIVIFGDSGNGKTWLYKEYFASNKIHYSTVDLSIAITEGLDEAILKSLPRDDWEALKKTERQSLGANFAIAKSGEMRTIEFQKRQAEALELALSNLKSKGSAKRFLVFDNFEQVSRHDDLVEQIASLIIRLDTQQFASYGVRLLFVGVVSDMKELIARYDHAGTISNRLTEIPEVERLTISEAEALIERGLVNKLRISFDFPVHEAIEQVRFMTDRNAQQIHELGYQIACEAEENNWRLSEIEFEKAQSDWADTSLSQHTAQVEARMNKRETKIQRRNQVLFSLGASETTSFRPSQIEGMIRKFFPDTVQAGQLGVDQILSSLAEGKNPILVRNPNDNSYRLTNPKLKLALRTRLRDLTSKKAPTVSDFMEKLREILERIDVVDVDQKNGR